MAKFPVTLDDEPQPGDPAAERTRQEIVEHPEGAVARIERTRRYFRLVRKASQLHYARGLESNPDDFA